MDPLVLFFSSARKAAVAGLGAVVTILTVYHQFAFLPDQPLVVSLLTAATAVLTYLVPNKSA